jgi:glycosyltransferase 2 family protein
MVTEITGLDQTVIFPTDNTPASRLDTSRSKIWRVVKLLIALLLVAYLLYTDKISFAVLGGFMGWKGILGGLGAALLISTSYVLTSLRLYYLFQANRLDICLRWCLKTNFIGLFANNYLPTAMGGDAVRAYLFTRGRSGQVAHIIATIAYDRLLGLLALVLLAFAALGLARVWLPQLAWTPAFQWSFMLLGAGLGGAFGAVFLSRSALALRFIQALCAKLPFGEALARFFTAFSCLSRSGRLFLLLLAMSFLVHMCCALALYFTGQALGLHTGLGLTILLAPLIFLSGVLPVSPGNLGWTEYVGSWLWSSQGLAWGGSLWLAYRVVTVVVSLIGLVFYLQTKVRKPVIES